MSASGDVATCPPTGVKVGPDAIKQLKKMIYPRTVEYIQSEGYPISGGQRRGYRSRRQRRGSAHIGSYIDGMTGAWGDRSLVARDRSSVPNREFVMHVRHYLFQYRNRG